MRTDFIDYPTAWEIQETSTLEHDPECSTVVPEGGPMFLCDCGAMPLEWAKRACESEPHRADEINELVKEYLPARRGT